MKLVADTAMLVIGLTLVVGGVLGVVRYRPGEPYSPDQRSADTAAVYVSGSEGVAYWMLVGLLLRRLRGTQRRGGGRRAGGLRDRS